MNEFGILDEKEYVRIIRIFSGLPHDESTLYAEIETGNLHTFYVRADRVVPLNNEE